MEDEEASSVAYRRYDFIQLLIKNSLQDLKHCFDSSVRPNDEKIIRFLKILSADAASCRQAAG